MTFSIPPPPPLLMRPMFGATTVGTAGTSLLVVMTRPFRSNSIVKYDKRRKMSYRHLACGRPSG
jgi:urease alpha subunit